MRILFFQGFSVAWFNMLTGFFIQMKGPACSISWKWIIPLCFTPNFFFAKTGYSIEMTFCVVKKREKSRIYQTLRLSLVDTEIIISEHPALCQSVVSQTLERNSISSCKIDHENVNFSQEWDCDYCFKILRFLRVTGRAISKISSWELLSTEKYNKQGRKFSNVMHLLCVYIHTDKNGQCDSNSTIVREQRFRKIFYPLKKVKKYKKKLFGPIISVLIFIFDLPFSYQW